MKKIVAWNVLIALSFLILFTIGCVSYSGNKIIADRSVTSQIKPNVTTKDEVRTLCGEPTNIQFTDEDEEIWSYYYTKTKTRAGSYIPLVGLVAGGADTETHSLVVKFTEDGIVKKAATGGSTGGGGGIQDMDD